MVHINSLIVLVLIVAVVAFVQAKPRKTKQGSESSSEDKGPAKGRKPSDEQEQGNKSPSKSKPGQKGSSEGKDSKGRKKNTPRKDLSDDQEAMRKIESSVIGVYKKTKALQKQLDVIGKG